MSNMHIGEKIKILRLNQGLSQENIAHAVGRSVAYVSRLERGEAECDNETAAKIKKLLGIEKAPLFEHELELYEGRIWAWNNLVTDRRMDEAKKIQETLAPILSLPYEHELIMLYQMIAFAILGWEWDTNASSELISALEEKISSVEYFVDNASKEARILYFRNKGILYGLKGDGKNAIKYTHQALDIKSDKLVHEAHFYAAVGASYVRSGRYVSALKYYEYASNMLVGDHTSPDVDVNNLAIGACYYYMRNYTETIKIIEPVYRRARSLNTQPHYIIVIACFLGSAKYKMKAYEESIVIYDDALSYSSDRKDIYISILVFKALALNALKKIDESMEVFQHALTMADGDETQTIIVETAKCFTSPKDTASIEYLVNTSLPFITEMPPTHCFDVLDICEVLEAYYRKRGAVNKANAIAAISRDIYEQMVKGRDDLD